MSGSAGQAVTELTGWKVSHVRQLGGGDSQAAFAVQLEDGRMVFAKTAAEHMPGAVAAEAASLRWLAEPGSVAIPAVHGNDDHWLVTEHIHFGAPTASAAEELGRGLARIHRAGADAHGCAPPDGPKDAWIGLAPMRNEPARDWPSFYATHRIAPYLREAVDAGALGSADAATIGEVCEHIHELAGPAEPPSRLHGDLWSGNVQWGSDGRAWLIDPAAHGGHRETDLAMLALFGCPHLERIIAAYHEVSPLRDGWRTRVSLHQLFPLLVHTVLFGGGYGNQAGAAARRALSA